ncbi:MAG: glycosyltransferase [Pirellulaceae bacterium]|jgi:glycosyltransferase involved in cell wall biosynthesis|nr:glycosyltransferase [Pirellulaceae bacterium]MDP6555235.1 glycosyltransferase [Pirellulaceae bacterium]MDP6719437.1 glycosyltransferase [Pirellulaceae bacterium]
MKHRREQIPLGDRGPLRVMFVITSMPVGGAETLLVNLIRGLDSARFSAEVCCLKARGPLGELLADEVPVHSHLLSSKLDVRVLSRLRTLIRERRIDAVITVGAGDKMFWGRLAAWLEGVPVILSALHSTGWPDTIGRLNRLLTPITDAFVGVAAQHGDYLTNVERFPARLVRVIPNGIDVNRFCNRPGWRRVSREALGLGSEAPVVGIVAALRAEKNHTLFLQAAARLREEMSNAQFLIVGDGPERGEIERTVAQANLSECVHLLGARADIPELLAALDIFALTSHIEANPVSILEAMAMGLPVVATDVGSVSEIVLPGVTGFLASPGSAEELAGYWAELLGNRPLAQQIGSFGRELVSEKWSLDAMIAGYQDLIGEIYSQKCSPVMPSAATHSGPVPPMVRR